MMTDFEILCELLKKEAVVEVEKDQHGKNILNNHPLKDGWVRAFGG
ncbi:hypothetical protein [Candidatus Venteria ishoeyi]|nr:hypothetical protein [Candidatus Venteria ishoeyi]MDM8547165.1 hypothetical protein [Candidatus Venteria ishoeyi]